ncbi:MAG TPA: S8 family serine peptidase, partial [Gaiellaceae bacterium]|nr:S8 family serine peptidase [Gaiellaceae bacterium]
MLAAVGGEKVYDYRYAFNGFAAEMTRGQVRAAKADPSVLTVEKAQEVTMDTATTPTFLGLTDPNTGLWTPPRNIKGENVVIGVVDSGVWPESKSFSDRDASGQLIYHPNPGIWHGRKCHPGEAWNASMCNQKLIGAQFFCQARGCDGVLEHEFLSPRDYNGHGTHTASTAGGNQNVATTGAAELFGHVNGIAPRARIAAYKVCWDNGAGGCGANTGDSVAAIDQAVADGVDVINYSISGTSTNYLDAVEVAYLFAADAGVFVATSAGNSGPTASTVAHISPWLASVAAGTHNRNGVSSVTLGNGATINGASLTPGAGPAPFVHSTAVGLPGAPADRLRQCFSASANGGTPLLDPAQVAGKIVLCERGGSADSNARVDKSAAVREAGGVGVVIANVAANSLNADLHSLPTVHVAHTEFLGLAAYAATAGATATLAQAIGRCARQPDGRRMHERSRAGTRGQRGTVDRRPVPERDAAHAVAVVRARRDRGQPRADVRDGRSRRARVAGRGGDEDARIRGEQVRNLDSVEVVRRGAADRVVDDVDAVRDRLVDGGDAVTGVRSATARAVVPADLVCRDARPRSDAVDRAEQRGLPRRRDALVAAGRRRGVRAVAVVVARRAELVLEHAVTAACLAEELCADQLLVTHRCVPCLARMAFAAVPDARIGLVDQPPAGVTVAEALRLRPDARV